MKQSHGVLHMQEVNPVSLYKSGNNKWSGSELLTLTFNCILRGNLFSLRKVKPTLAYQEARFIGFNNSSTQSLQIAKQNC